MKTMFFAAVTAAAVLSLGAPASATTVLLSFDGLACTNADGGATNSTCVHNQFIGADYGSTTGLTVTYDAGESSGSVTSLRSYDGGFYPNEGAYAFGGGSEFSLITFTPAVGYEVSFNSFIWGHGSATQLHPEFQLADPDGNLLFDFAAGTQGNGSHVANTAYFSGPLTFRFRSSSGGLVMDDIAVDLRQVATGGVPEPATWAMMILGFGAAGSMVRRRRTALA